jgi:hypothetical protein
VVTGSTRQFRLDRPVLLSPILGLHRRGGGDPTHRWLGDIWLRTTRTPAGPALIKIIGQGNEVAARAWGEGAEWALDQLPRLVGEADDPAGFQPLPEHGPLVEAERRYGHFRVGRTVAVFEALAPACIEQVVTGKEAFRAWRILVRDSVNRPRARPPIPNRRPTACTCRRPGGVGTGTELAIPGRRRRTAAEPDAGADCGAGGGPGADLTGSGEQADRALRSFPGVGQWTSAEVRQRAHGDADAWSIGDYHVAKDITYTLTGEVLDDDACEEILEPYRGHRFRVQSLLGMVGSRRPAARPADVVAHPYAIRHPWQVLRLRRPETMEAFLPLTHGRIASVVSDLQALGPSLLDPAEFPDG